MMPWLLGLRSLSLLDAIYVGISGVAWIEFQGSISTARLDFHINRSEELINVNIRAFSLRVKGTCVIKVVRRR